METYRDLSHASGVTGYEIGRDFIDVRFRRGETYRYDYASAGKPHIEEMKRLARAGRGLSTYISQHVRDDYARKIK